MSWIDRIVNALTSLYISFRFQKIPTPLSENDFYDSTASVYTSLFSLDKNDDIGMYLHFAEKTGSPVLDAACGDGRISLPLAQNGHSVYGFDISENLLNICRNRIAQDPMTNELSIKLCRASMAHIPFKEKFNLVIVPYNSFNHLLTESDQRSCLAGLYSTLRKHGLLVMEVLPYHSHYVTRIRRRKTGPVPGSNRRISAYSRVIHDPNNSLHTVYWYITAEKPGQPAIRTISSFTRKDVPLDRIHKLITEAGFTLKESLNSYPGDEKTGNKRIVVAQKR